MMLFPNMDMLADLPREPFSGGPYVIGAKRRLPMSWFQSKPKKIQTEDQNASGRPPLIDDFTKKPVGRHTAKGFTALEIPIDTPT